jgi:hypothetical protein
VVGGTGGWVDFLFKSVISSKQISLFFGQVKVQ